MTLQLTPNEIVGYRIKPDWYSFNVVLVKRHGPSSKSAGQEYETTVAYCKSIPFAVDALLSHATRLHGIALEKEVSEQGQLPADSSLLVKAIEMARADALAAVSQLTERLTVAGLTTPKKVTQFLGEAPSEQPVEVPEPSSPV